MFRARPLHLKTAFFASLFIASAAPMLAGESSKLQVHGFLTQAFGTANFATGPAASLNGGQNYDERLIGIPEDGTFDYRNLALQFRYEVSDRDTMVVQFSHEATGVSPVDALRDEVELDWAFYERRIGTETRLKVGRVQIPWGIYNETRDVGTVLPFYRPAYAIYLEGGFTSETVDGLSLGHTFAAASDWSVDLDLYAGEYEAFEVTLDGQVTAPVRAKDVFGAQLWLNTPVPGLRFGTAFQSKSVEEGLEGLLRPVGGANKFTDLLYSIEGDFDRWSLRAEYRTFDPDNLPSLFGSAERAKLELESSYIQLGYGIQDNVRVFVQFESQEFKQISGDFAAGSVAYNQREDLGIAVNYLFSPQIVLKAEYHDYSYQGPAIFPIFRPGLPPLLGAEVLDADDGDYQILSLSISF